MNLYISEAIAFVRARLDEIAQTDSDMVVDTTDDRNLNLTVEKLLPEAVADVHLAAPASLLEGEKFNRNSGVFGYSVTDGVIDIDFRSPALGNSGIDVMRLVYFKCADGILTSTVFSEDSPEGRIQLNKYIQGQPDEPVIVRQADSEDWRPHFKYYTTKLEQPTFEISVFPVPELTTTTGSTSSEAHVFVSAQLKLATLNRLVQKVLITYGDAQRAQAFMQATK